MKESKYNFYLNDDEYNINLIYNAFKNTLIRDDGKKVQHFIKLCKNDIQFNSEYITEAEFNDLVSSGIIVSNDANEKQSVIYRNNKRLEQLHQKNDVLSLVITPTLQCNFKCYYCFESINTRKREESINMEVQNDILHFIEKSITENHIKEVDITWYGGEPLIQSDIIYSMQKKIGEICRYHNIKFNSNIVTNGILLLPETCNLLYEYGIKQIQITIDGPEHIHNKHRYYPENPTNNYNQILENILNSNNNIHYNIRINIDKTNKDFIFELIEDLIKRKVWPYKKNVSIYTAHIASASITDLSPKEFSVLQDQIRYYLREKYSEINHNFIKKAKLEFIYPKLGGNKSCGYGISRNSWVISYNGDVFRCWDPVGQKEHRVGTMKDLLEDFGNSIFEKIKLDIHTFEQWGCFDCKFFPICGSKCHWNFIKNNEERKCTEWKNVLEYRLLNQYKLYLKEPEVFDKTPFNVDKI